MSFLDYLLGRKKNTAAIARERLQIILAHERQGPQQGPDYLPQLQQELVAVISKYIAINPDDIKVQLDRKDNLDVLEVNIVLPEKDAQEQQA
jgi:cell division topological specificity factor